MVIKKAAFVSLSKLNILNLYLIDTVISSHLVKLKTFWEIEHFYTEEELLSHSNQKRDDLVTPV